MDRPVRVAVIGASGIGQHHARWYHLSGCEVVAFAGTSEASCAQTQARLKDYFGFEGRAYTDVAQLLDREQPDIVDVSSPFHLHRAHALIALEAGCHVVCEKPLCWDVKKELDQIVEDGKAVVAGAKQAGKLLAVSAQYPASIPFYWQLYERVRGSRDPVERISMEMEVKGRRGPKFREEIWVDVASHPLSLVLGFLPGGAIDFETASCVIAERENRATFDYVTPEGRCAVEIILRDIDDGSPVRRFGVNGFLADWEGFPDENGVYRARLSHGEEEISCKDFMHILIDEFAKAVRGDGGQVVVSGEAGLINLTYQADLLRQADRPS
ncbi:MAG: Gfo/Idh/MocA family oxidoreductase [bacterium]|nr:Gfo/Idh/MocA family oxidoreductase [bacterium]